MKRIAKILLISLCLAMLVPSYSSASSDPYDVTIGGYLRQSDAKSMLNEINNYRISQGMKPLSWNSDFEQYSAQRVAELSLFYSFTRPDGTDGLDYRIGQLNLEGETIDSRIKDFISTDADFRRAITDNDIKSFSAGVFKSYDGDIYYSMNLLTDESSDTSLYYDDDDYTFSILVKDGYLNTEAFFMDKNLNDQNPSNLIAGNTYNYWIYNYNERCNDRVVIFETQYSRSSNKNVVTIDEKGAVKAKSAGTAKLTIKPAAESGITYATTVTVKPRPTSLLKLTGTKKAFTAKWKKGSNITGYELQYALNSKFTKSKKTVKITKAATVSKKITKLKAKKKYYVRIRAYKTVNGKKYYSTWSKTKTVTTKK